MPAQGEHVALAHGGVDPVTELVVQLQQPRADELGAGTAGEAEHPGGHGIDAGTHDREALLPDLARGDGDRLERELRAPDAEAPDALERQQMAENPGQAENRGRWALEQDVPEAVARDAGGQQRPEPVPVSGRRLGCFNSSAT